jgi:hypothetical protein
VCCLLSWLYAISIHDSLKHCTGISNCSNKDSPLAEYAVYKESSCSSEKGTLALYTVKSFS